MVKVRARLTRLHVKEEGDQGAADLCAGERVLT